MRTIEHHHRGQRGERDLPRPAGEADGARQPERGAGGDVQHLAVRGDDDARHEEGHAGRHGLDQVERVHAHLPVRVGDEVRGHQLSPDDHVKAGGERHEHVGAQARGLLPPLPLGPDQPAEDDGGDDAQERHLEGDGVEGARQLLGDHVSHRHSILFAGRLRATAADVTLARSPYKWRRT